MSRRASVASRAPSPSRVHSAWKRASRLEEPRHRLQRGHDRFVLLEDEQLLRRVAPPAVRMVQMPDELRGGLVVHPRHGLVAIDGVGAALDAVVHEPPDAAVVDHLVEVVLFDPRAEVRAGARPLPFLNDPVVHVHDVHGPVRRDFLIDRAEVRIGRLDELVLRRQGVHVRQPFFVLRVHAPDGSRDGLAVAVRPVQLLWQPIRADNHAAGAGRRLLRGSVRHPDEVRPALHVGDEHRRAPGDPDVGVEPVGNVDVAVDDRELPVRRDAVGALEVPLLAVVVLGQAPLRAHRAPGCFLDDPAGRPARAERVEGRVQPVVQRPGHRAFQVLDVVDAAVARAEQLLLVGDAVAVRVGVLPEFLRVGLLRQDRVGPVRRDEAGEDQLVDEDGVPVVDAVVVRVGPQGDASDGVELAGRFLVGHVTRVLEDEHPAVAVEHDGRRVLDARIGQHELEAVSRLKDERLELFRRCLRQDGRLLRPVDVGHRLGAPSGRRTAAGALCRSARLRPARCGFDAGDCATRDSPSQPSRTTAAPISAGAAVCRIVS